MKALWIALIAALQLCVGVTLSAAAVEADRCEVHHVTMSKQDVPIEYGYPSPELFRFMEAAAKLFPHSGMPLQGGCVINQNSPHSRQVFVCSRCRSEAAAWLEAKKRAKH